MHAGGPSEDTLQRVLPLVLQRLEPNGAVQLFQVRKPSPSLLPVSDALCAASHGSPGSRVVFVGLVAPPEP